jgi:uncharacterized protein
VGDLESLAVELPDGVDVAELHGMICGLVCGEPDGATDVRLRAILDLLDSDLLGIAGGEDVGLQIDSPVARFMAAAEADLQATDMSFAPLLPGDDEALTHRLQALADWCAGFLVAFGAVSDPQVQSQEALEALEDIARFAEADPDSGVAGHETDFVEIVEYLRVAVMLLLESAGESPEADADGPG